MPCIRAEEIGGLEFMQALLDWRRVDLTTKPEGDGLGIWAVSEKVNDVISGRFFVLLANEDEMTDDIAYYAVQCEDDEDAVKIAASFEGAVLQDKSPPRPPPGETPQWLKDYATNLGLGKTY